MKISLLLHNDAKCHDAFIRVKFEENDSPCDILLTPGSTLEDYRFYDCEIETEEGLFWYSFRYTSDYGEFFVTKTSGGIGTVTDSGAWWQQTVYCKDFTVPENIKGGIIYQIFPDRFYNSGHKKIGIPTDRYIVEDWNSQPEYRQEDEKKCLGNDYFGGDLDGICEKLEYLKSLGVTCIYLNPIFEAHSNHRYNTADYMKIDPSLGDESSFKSLCEKAEGLGISIILDGVFSHTGNDSIYFNSVNRYPSCGAANSENSPYKSWYKFKHFPDKYDAWWGIKSLPETNENDPDFTEFITGEKGVLRHWLKLGASGWRLDVADELPDEFLDKLRIAVKEEKPNAYILGEVWEDASNKISYGSRRRFIRGKQLDSVMNYPFADAIIAFIKGENAEHLVNTVMNILENYPKPAIDTLMNHIGTHDTPRLITRLMNKSGFVGDRAWQSHQKLSDDDFTRGITLVKLAATVQYTLPGIPSLYYGDEIGLEGFGDPFCRKSFDWTKTDSELTEYYRTLGKIRKSSEVFKDGEFIPLLSDGGTLAYLRKSRNLSAVTVVNRSESTLEFPLPKEFKNSKSELSGNIKNGILTLPPLSATILVS